MLCVNSYKQDYIDECRSSMESQLAAYKTLLTTARAKAGTGEWSSLRFSNGARVNLYNFANGYQVATYQKADGSTQWLDSFLLRQNGYLRTPERGVWLSWGWSYEFPVEIEGSRHYTLEPFSKLDVYENPANILFEGPSRLINDDTARETPRPA